MKVTAKVKLNTKYESNEAFVIGFMADYDDDRNKEWAKYTPSISISMTVKPEVAEKFNVGDAFTLTFDKEEA